MADPSTAAQRVDSTATSQPPYASPEPAADPVLLFQSVVRGVFRELTAVDERAAAVLAVHSASWLCSSAAALAACRRRIAAVHQSAPLQPVPASMHRSDSRTEAPSLSAMSTFPSIDRAFTLLARRLQRPFTPNQPTAGHATLHTHTATLTPGLDRTAASTQAQPQTATGQHSSCSTAGPVLGTEVEWRDAANDARNERFRLLLLAGAGKAGSEAEARRLVSANRVEQMQWAPQQQSDAETEASRLDNRTTVARCAPRSLGAHIHPPIHSSTTRSLPTCSCNQ